MDRVRWADVRDFVVRVVAPALVLWGFIVGVGFVLTGPLAGPLNAEDAVNQGLAVRRGGALDTATFVWSYLGSTELILGVCLLVSAVVLVLTRDWRLAIVPTMAILLQLCVYLAVTALVRRERPSVERLETLLPMSSFPSGHVGASTALYLAFVLLASRVERVGLRWAVTGVSLAVPLLVAFSRLYRGLHHLSDIVAGLVVGGVCALLAYGWYLHRNRTTTTMAAGARTEPSTPTPTTYREG